MKINLRQPVEALLMAALVAGGACAMEAKRAGPLPNCSVIGDEKVLAAVGGRDALCREIAASLSQGGKSTTAKVIVQVRPSHLSARVEVGDGRTLPEIGFAISDRPLTNEMVRRFGSRIAAAINHAGS